MKKTNSGGIVAGAAANAFLKLDPRVMMHNPVMFVTEVGSAVTTVYWILALIQGIGAGFIGAIALCLWFTVLFANFAEAMAEGRGKAQADTLRQMLSQSLPNVFSSAITIIAGFCLSSSGIASARSEFEGSTRSAKGERARLM